MNRLLRTASFLFACIMISTTYSFANSITISNGELTDQNTSSGFVNIEFDISWENSWRDGVNYDAAWVFAKYSVDNGETWSHASLALSGINPNGFSTGSGTSIEIVVPADLKGAFIQRSSSGVGTVEVDDMQIVWDYGVDGVDDSDVHSSAILKVYAVEMVYVPSGAFYAGDNATSSASFREGSSDADPWFINAAGAIPVTNTSSNGYYYVSSGYIGEDATGTAFTIPSSFPSGYNAFYVMKYEVSEGQWVSFFNTLTATQKTNRDITSATGKNTDATFKRNTVSYTSDSATTEREDRACNYLSWMDSAAFADWAALRPLTELEYEKTARGTLSSVAGEFAWGSTSITSATSISGTENGNETVSNSGANAVYNNVTFAGGDGGEGPVRSGIFSKSNSSRPQAGSGYYGVMELSGNLSERIVSVGNSSGRSYTGLHGDGVLTASGFANVSGWPGYDGSAVSSADGSGIRGGAWSDSSLRLRTSDRAEASQNLTSRQSRFGFRGARTAP